MQFEATQPLLALPTITFQTSTHRHGVPSLCSVCVVVFMHGLSGGCCFKQQPASTIISDSTQHSL